MLAANYDIMLDRAADYSLALTINNYAGTGLDVHANNFYGDVRDAITKQQVVSFVFDKTTAGASGLVTVTISAANTRLLHDTLAYEYDIFIVRAGQTNRLLEGMVSVRNNRTNDTLT